MHAAKQAINLANTSALLINDYNHSLGLQAYQAKSNYIILLTLHFCHTTSYNYPIIFQYITNII